MIDDKLNKLTKEELIHLLIEVCGREGKTIRANIEEVIAWQKTRPSIYCATCSSIARKIL